MKPLPWKATDFRAVTHAFALGFYFRVSTEGSSNGFFVCQRPIDARPKFASTQKPLRRLSNKQLGTGRPHLKPP